MAAAGMIGAVAPGCMLSPIVETAAEAGTGGGVPTAAGVPPGGNPADAPEPAGATDPGAELDIGTGLTPGAELDPGTGIALEPVTGKVARAETAGTGTAEVLPAYG